ncbi:DUF5801 repeats-in-toxin domain-containing protein [Nitratireductor sp. OM-1]|uniref:DUF5801 repeats-in-toxin domain-containing protein n=1 Tax=Nitratireductor sp. OM-1 TaxID=1756988 RepID=UPI000DDCB43E|nr:DUF5801 repeats-in-toxin domain-containing protein [Nitratireductor sp. OM-1]
MPAASLPAELAADADNVVRLPQGVSIDEIRLDGNNLVLVQPDGSTVTILNAALKVPTFLIGDVEIPELALAAALQANGIDVAAGPDGALTVVSAASQSGGGGFNTPNGDIGDAGPVIDLLPPTALQFGTLERRELFPSIRENDFPELSIVSLGTPPGQVNESALASGSGGGTTSTLGNVLVDPGGDGLGSLVVTNASGVSVDVTNGGTIQGVYGELIVTPNGDGTYGFEYVLTTNTIDHANAGQTEADDVVTDTFDFVVTDGNGDTASDELTVTITDDGPAIDLAPAEESEIVLDETDNDADDGDVGGLLADLTVPGSALFTETATPGADGAQSKVYSLILNAGATGLTDTLSGEPVVLSEEGGAIVGRTQTGGDEVFRISVDANTGDITVSQSRALFHDQNPGSDAEAHDESLTPEVMNSGLVSLNVVLTDGDGDTASDTAELGALIKFEDDGPSIEASNATLPSLVTDDTDITDTTGPVSFAGLFTHDFGADGFKDTDDNDDADADAISYALSLNNGTDSGLVDTLSGDAILLRVDGNGDIEGYLATDTNTVAFKIDINPDTGDVTLTQNRSVVHDDVNDPVETGTSAAKLPSNVITLTATVTDGDGDQDTASVDIGGAFSFEDDGPSIEASNATLPSLVTDDTDITDTTGPVSFAGLFTHDFGADGFKDTDDNDDADADAISYALSLNNGTDSGLVDTLSGDAILLRVDGNGDIEGYLATDTNTVAFKIDINPDTGDVTLTQNRSVVHDDVNDPVETGTSAAKLPSNVITLTATVTDGDGDQDTASVDIGGAFSFEDDGPSIEASNATLPSLVTDDTDITDTTGPVSFAGLFTHDFGADGFKDTDDNDDADADAISYALSLNNGTDSGLVDTLSGDAILLRVDGNGDIEGYLATDTNTVAFKIDINPDTGDVTLTQNRSVVHDDVNDPVETGTSAAKLPSNVITLTATVTDGDGDQDTASVDIGGAFSFEDDGPSIEASNATLPSLVTDDTDITDTTGPVSFAGLFTHDFGADGFKDTDDNDDADADAISYALSLNNGTDSGLVDTLSGDAILLRVDGNGDIEGYLATDTNTVAFKIDINPDTGDVTLTQNRSVVHDDVNDPVETGTSAAKLPSNVITLTATVTDGDGDQDTASVDIGGAFSFEDDGPSIEASNATLPSLVTDDTDITDTTGPVSFAGLFTHDFGADGFKDTDDNDDADADAISYALSLNNGTDSGLVDTLSGDAILLRVDGNGDIEGYLATDTNTVAFKIDINPDTGDVTLTQNRSVVHDDVNDPVETGTSAAKLPSNVITLTATVTDGDGDQDTASVDIGGAFSFEDDGPSIEASNATLPSLVTDDTDITDTTGPVSFAGLFTHDFGADGFKDTDDNDDADADAISYALSLNNGTDSGLVDTLSGDAILLRVDGNGDIEGYLATDTNTVAFKIDINPDTGDVTLTQNRSVVHDDVNDPVETGTSAAKLPSNVITLTATVTDGDGDQDTASVDIGGAFSFEDDGPSIEASNATLPSLVTDDTDITDTTGPVSFAGLFTHDFGADGFKDTDDNDDADADAISYALSLNNGTDSGLVDTLSGDAILLRVDGNGDIEGYLATDTNTVAFKIDINPDTGDVTLTQNRSVVHDDVNDPVETGTSAAKLPSNVITLTATVTDGDGDQDTASVDIGGAFSFEDDGPSIEASNATLPSLVTDDTDITDTTGPVSFAGLFTHDFGADGFKDTDDNDDADADAISYALSLNNGTDSGLVDTLSGDAILLRVDGNGDIEGYLATDTNTVAFKIDINPDTGDVTLTQNRSVVHDDVNDPVETGTSAAKLPSNVITLTATVTDGDGDQDTASVDIGGAFSFEDDGPSIEASNATLPSLVTDDTDITDTTGPVSFAGLFTHDFGADGFKDTDDNDDADADAISYALSLNNGTDSGLVDTLSGDAILLRVDGNGDIEGYLATDTNTVAFKIDINPDTGDVTLTQNRSVVHDDVNDPVETGTSAAKLPSNVITLTATVTDGDGDQDTASVDIGGAFSFEDDGPSIEASNATLPSLVTDDTDITDTTGPVSFAGLFTHDFGADGFKDTDDNDDADADAISYALSLNNGTDSGLVDTLSGDAILLRVDGNGDIEGYLATDTNTVAFKIDINPDTGDVTLTQNRSVVHDDVNDPVETGTSAAKLPSNVITLTATVTDGDGDQDTASVDIGGAFSFEDDGPSIEASNATLPSLVTDDTDITDTTGPVSFAGLFTHDFGADGFKDTDDNDDADADAISYALSLNNGTDSGLVDTLSGDAILLRVDGNGDIEGYLATDTNTVAFKIDINPDTGDVTLTQNRSVVHDDVNDPVETGTSAAKLPSNVITLTATVTDGDGDQDTASVDIGGAFSFEDDGPSIEASNATLPSLVTDDTDITDTTGPVSFAGLFTHDFGADGFKDTDDNDDADADAISYALSLNNGTDSGLVDTLSGDAILLRVDGNGDIEGYLATDTNTVAFKIDINPDTGDVTLTQNRSVVHDDVNDPVETGTSAAKLPSNVITLTATVTDGDGDQDTASVDIGGAFSFEDDGPSIEASNATLPSLVTDDTDITDTTGPVSFAGLFTHDFGADGFKDTDDNDDADADAISYALSLNNGTDSGLVDTLSGDAILLRVDGNGDIEGYLATDTNTVAFKIDINPDTGDVTLTQNRSVVHDDVNDPVETGTSAAKLPSNVITLTATVTDGDGDQDTASVDIGGAFSFEDDGPSIEASNATLPSLVTDDTDITDTTGPVSFAGLFTHDFGADGFKDTDDNDDADADAISYALSLNNGTDSGLVDTLSGDAILLRVDGNGDIEGYLATDTNTVAFKIDINPDTGDVTLTQNRSVVHDDVNDPVETGTSAAKLPSNVITLTATVTDGDGDQDTASVDIGGAFSFEDDGPSIEASNATLPSLVTDDTDITDTTGPVSFAGLFTHDFGADGFKDTDDNDDADADAISYALSLNNGTDSGLVDTLSGDAILLRVDGNGDIEGYLATDTNTVAFKIDINPDTGDVTLTQNRSVVHDDVNDPVETGTSAAKLPSNVITLTATVTDGDGDQDTASVDIGGAFSFEDDGPSIEASNATLPSLVTDDTDITDTTGPVSFAGLFTHDFGADGFKDTDDNDDADADAISYALSLNNGTDSGLVDTLSGDAILLRVDGNGDIEGYLATDTNTVAFKIDINPDTGDVTLTQNRSVVHDDVNDPVETGTSAAKLPSNVITLTATVTDGDGDQDTASVDIGGAFSFEDDGPSIEASNATLPSLVTDDTDITDTTGPVSFAGLFTHDFGADGFKDTDDNDDADADAISYALSLNNGTDSGLVDTLSGDAILLRVDGNGDIEGYLATDTNTVAFKIDINPDTGDVTLTQNRSVVHDDVNDPVETGTSAAKLPSNVITLTATVTDGDGDQDTASVDIGGAFSFEDDGPSIEASNATLPSLVTDDTDITDTTGPVSFAGLFTHDFGADGFKDTDDNDDADADAISYALSLNNGTDSGLVDTLSGDAILLRVDGNGDIEGYLATDTNTVAFKIDINPDTGDVTLTQNRSVVHDDVNDPVETGTSAAKLPSNVITLTATVTDGDGDQDTASVDIGGAFSFEDDGPSIEASNATLPSLVTDDTDITDTTGPVSFAGLFTHDFGADGFKDTDDNDDADADAISYALSLNNGTDSGLVDTLSGDAILLRVDGNGDIEGYLATDTNTVAFKIDINPDTGDVTLTQNRSVVHDDVNDPVETGTSAAKLPSNVITLTATVTDGDGDQDTASVDIGGAFSFEDDGPSIEASNATLPSLVTDDTDITDTTGPVSFAGLFTHDFGADGFKDTDDNDDADADAISYALSLNNGTDSGLVDTLSGDAILLRVDGNGDIEGYLATDTNTVAFKIDINPDTGDVTLTQNRSVVHDDVNDPVETGTSAAKLPSNVITLTATVTDGDGDQDTASVDIGGAFSFEDDGPTVIVPEDAVLSNSAGTPQEFDLDVDGMVTDNYGADGAGTVRFTVTDGQESGLTSGGQPVTYHLSAGGTVLTAKVGGAGGVTVFTVTLDPADGTYTVDMDRPVDAFTQVDFDPGIYDFVGGNDPWAGFVPNGQDGNSPVDDNSRDLLLTPIGASGSSINGNAASAGVGGGLGGQNIGPGEGIRLDFVQDLTGDPAGAPADYQGNVGQQDHLFDGHYTVNGAAVTFGDGSSDTTIRLSAFDDPDGNTTVGDGAGDSITSIVIAYDGENQVITYDPLDTYPTTVTVGSPGGLADRSYTVDFLMVGGARVAQVTGVLDTQVTITSFTADGYNSLEVLYISGDDFAMTGFGTSVVSTDPVDFTLPIEIVDGDGDTAPAEIDITLQPDAAPTISAFTAEVNEAGLAGGTEEGVASTVDTGALSIALASGDTLDTLEVSDANGNWVDVTGGGTVQGKFGLLTVTANGSGGYSSSYQLNQNSLDHNVRPGKGTPEGVAERFNVRAKDNDGDYSAVDTLKVNVLDDAPEAVADDASLTLGTENFNIAFVLDFSGSVSKNELDAMLDAVKAAGQAFFDGTSGNVQIELVAFSSEASAAGPFTDYASFAAQIDAWNPTGSGSRPYNGGTDFTAAIEETMDAYTPLSDHNNQVFFLSDGNPNEQTGSDGHSLNGSTQTDWNNFVQDNDVTVQTVGIGNNIDVEQLQDVDEADGSDVVVSVSNFDDLVTALLDLTNQVDVSGNVLLGNDNAAGGGDDDILGADGGRILSITVDGVTYTYQDGPDKIFNDGGQPAINGSSLVVDGALGGELSFNFETGAWSYQADGDTTPGTESFDYVLVDNDGDTSGASLTIDILPPPGATDDVVLTNITDYSAIDIPTAALLHNDPAPASPLSVDGASNPQNGGVSLAGDVTFTPSSTPVEFVDEDFSSGAGSFIYRDAYYPGTGSEASGFRSTSGPASGGAMKIELGDGGGSDRYNVNGAFTRAFNLASAATVTITFDYYAMLTAETDLGEDVRVLAGVDGEAFGSGGVVDELLGASGSGGGDAVTGWKTFTTTIDLSAGDHTLALGGLLTQKTKSGEFAEVYFDNVNVEYTPTPSFTSGGFDYSVSDGSGFTDDAHVSVTGVSGSTITGTDADEVLVGNDSGSTLLGMGGDDSLVGGDAVDLLDGGEGDDLLIGGDGADVLTGGEGQNTYDLTDTDGAIDTVVLDPSALTGMNPDEIIGFSSEDVVDLSELVSLSTTPGDSIGDFVRLNPGDGKELQVDADGTAGGDDWVTVATFDVQPPASITILYKDDNGSDTSSTF